MKRLLILVLVFMSSCSSIDTEQKYTYKGYFSYLADAAIFIDCKTNEKYPVAMEADYITAETKYLDIASTPGERILIIVNGEISKRDKIEGNGKINFMIINKFLEILPNQLCN